MVKEAVCEKCNGSKRIPRRVEADVPLYSPGEIRIAKHGYPRNPDGRTPNPDYEALIEEIRGKIRRGESLEGTKRGYITVMDSCECLLEIQFRLYLGDEYMDLKYAWDRADMGAWKGSVLVVDELPRFKAAVQWALVHEMNNAGTMYKDKLPRHITTDPYDIMTRRANPDYHEGSFDPFVELRDKNIIVILRIITDPSGGGKYGTYIDSIVRWRIDEGARTWVFVDDGLGFDAEGKSRFKEMYGAETVDLLNKLNRVSLEGVKRKPGV